MFSNAVPMTTLRNGPLDWKCKLHLLVYLLVKCFEEVPCFNVMYNESYF